MPELKFSITSSPDYCLLQAQGTIDYEAIENFKSILRQDEILKAQNLILDLTAVSTLSSTGIGVILWSEIQCRQLGARLIIMCPNKKICKDIQFLSSGEMILTSNLPAAVQYAQEHLEALKSESEVLLSQPS
ncbi:MAG: STAS domain-containing protein [Planctomycetes bacterium]|nr:STAS domain-containing protein [Planctomycetota bacterium]